MTRLLATFGVCSLTLAAVAVENPEPTPEVLVAQLGSVRFADREAAARALEDQGLKALPALEAGTRSHDPEISRRCAELAARLRRQMDSAAHLEAKMLRLSYQKVPLGTAVNDLKARTGLNLVLEPDLVANPLRPVTIETRELPAWEAVDAFCKAAGLREVFAAELPVLQPSNQQRRGYYTPPPPPPTAEAVPVTLADGKHQVIPGSRATAVRVLALPRSFPGHRVFLGTSDVQLSFDVTPTPGLNWQDVCGVRITRLIDDTGRPGTGGTMKKPEVTQFDPFGGVALMGGPGRVVVMRWDMDGNPVLPTEHPNPRVIGVPLKVPTPGARSLKLLEGVVVGEVMAHDQPLATIANPARSPGARVLARDGSQVKLESIRDEGPQGTTFSVEIRSESPQQRGIGIWGGPMWPDQARPAGGGIQLKGLDAAGKPLTAASNVVTGINDDGTTRVTNLKLMYRGAMPTKLVVTGPMAVTVEVPFRMENVPLP